MLVVGASIAGVRAVQALRRQGYEGTLRLVGDEDVPAYRRPELSKRFLAGDLSVDQIALATPADLDCDVLLNARATRLEVADQRVWIGDAGADPRPYRFDGLVIATGAHARRLRVPPMAGVHVLRTHQDAELLRAELATSPRVVVVGGGLIGCEVAATCRSLGLAVTIVEPTGALMSGAIGREVGARITELQSGHGVDVCVNCGVTELRGGNRVESVVTSGGREIAADVVVVGIGSEPNTSWLAGSGLPPATGVLCAPNLAVVGARRAVGAGDVVAWKSSGSARPVRMEHWENAVRQAETAAHTLLLGESAPGFDGTGGLFWSHQFDATLHVLGDPRAADEVRFLEDDPGRQRAVACYARDGRVMAFALLNSADWLGSAGRLVRQRAAMPLHGTGEPLRR
ncbi:NADPH-dependent 2,4-dienoyl-CoA reductase/sulfur reductase-like enzyme [Kribbella kalugense]|uniref:NADPH-dependent 2,4-dienoyl-CoA reductase/sulfur reductase-like enzyme n=1 Tax=Kribbella kalugense TaxID=2512221 RepID=A0A4R8A1W9_9ACTN|nr:NADPH-dependent 2,4-dienoyl-CoA reductase/sulfur reductase-like enzyme [Kribbella kalugense]